MTNNIPNEILTADEAADVLRLSTSTLAKLRLYGKGPRFLKLGRAVRYQRHDLMDWLADKSRASTSDQC